MEDYRKLKSIGNGQFGDVLLVRSRKDGDLYAVKAVFNRMDSKEEEIAVNKEVQLLSSLEHPNIVKYKGSFFHENHLHIVMEYCQGGDLAQLIKSRKDKPFSECQILDWFVQLCMAVDYIHSRHILHRDLKSNNIFLTENNIVKLGDFGIARVLDKTLEQAKTCIGTPYYMSPEVCESKPYSYKSDIWALGCILYELCTRKHAFDSKNLLGLVFQIVQGKYPPVDRTSYSEELLDLLDSLLSVDPTMRPDIRRRIFRIPLIVKRMKMLSGSGGSLGRSPRRRICKKRSAFPNRPGMDSSMHLLRSSSSWLKASKDDDNDVLSAQTASQSATRAGRSERGKISGHAADDDVSSPSDAEYAAFSPAAASAASQPRRFRVPDNLHPRLEKLTTKDRLRMSNDRRLSNIARGAGGDRSGRFRSPVRRAFGRDSFDSSRRGSDDSTDSSTMVTDRPTPILGGSGKCRDPDERPIVSSGKYTLPSPESPKVRALRAGSEDSAPPSPQMANRAAILRKMARRYSGDCDEEDDDRDHGASSAKVSDADGMYSSDSDFEPDEENTKDAAEDISKRDIASRKRRDSASLDGVLRELRNITSCRDNLDDDTEEGRVSESKNGSSDRNIFGRMSALDTSYIERLRKNLRERHGSDTFDAVYAFLRAIRHDRRPGTDDGKTLLKKLGEKFGKDLLEFCFEVDQFAFLEDMAQRRGSARSVK
eukprot:g787.t1